MSARKYTPGPWSWREGLVGYSITNAIGMLALAFGESDINWKSSGVIGDECEGNARAIAAVPELIESLDPRTLQAIADAIKNSPDPHAAKYAENLRELARRQFDALAKAGAL